MQQMTDMKIFSALTFTQLVTITVLCSLQYATAADALPLRSTSGLESESEAQTTANFYMLAAVDANASTSPPINNIVNLYELRFSSQNGNLQSQSLVAWNISQVEQVAAPFYDAGLSSFYSIDPDIGQENIYMLALATTSQPKTASLSSYSIPLNKTRDIFTNQSMPESSTNYFCTRYDRSSQTAYSIGFSLTSVSTILLVVALPDAQDFTPQPIFEMTFDSEYTGLSRVPCALIPADASGTSTALFSFMMPGINQLFTISVTPTNSSLYAAPAGVPSIDVIEPTLAKNSGGNPTLFYVSSTFPPTSMFSNFGTIDVLTGLSDILRPVMPDAISNLAFEPRVTPAVLAFTSEIFESSTLTITWMTVGIEQTQTGGDYDRIVYINTGNFTIPGETQDYASIGVFGMFTVGLNAGGSVNNTSQTALIADL